VPIARLGAKRIDEVASLDSICTTGDRLGITGNSMQQFVRHECGLRSTGSCGSRSFAARRSRRPPRAAGSARPANDAAPRGDQPAQLEPVGRGRTDALPLTRRLLSLDQGLYLRQQPRDQPLGSPRTSPFDAVSCHKPCHAGSHTTRQLAAAAEFSPTTACVPSVAPTSARSTFLIRRPRREARRDQRRRFCERRVQHRWPRGRRGRVPPSGATQGHEL
jgi:hypothetical protein